MIDNLNSLATFSRRLGADRALAQGGGGNTSLKDNNRRMWIKASGLALADVTAETGFAPVDYPALRENLGTLTTEATYTDLIQSSLLREEAPSPLRPSLETGFHALLGKAVLHSHSVWLNLLSCATQGRSLAQHLFPDALWIAYTAPGLPLTQVISKVLPAPTETTILLLQNHGLIVSAPSLEEAWNTQQKIGTVVRDHFSLSDIYPPSLIPSPADEDHVLFPDQAVFLQNPVLAGSQAGKETLEAYSFIRQTLEKLGLSPHYLARADVSFLLAMEAEKYRQKVITA